MRSMRRWYVPAAVLPTCGRRRRQGALKKRRRPLSRRVAITHFDDVINHRPGRCRHTHLVVERLLEEDAGERGIAADISSSEIDLVGPDEAVTADVVLRGFEPHPRPEDHPVAGGRSVHHHLDIGYALLQITDATVVLAQLF